MNCNFRFSQSDYLKYLTEDIDLRRGVCFAMTREWLLNEMLRTRKPAQYYTQVYRFASQQRVVNDLWSYQGKKMLALKSDPYKIIDQQKRPRHEGNRIHSDNDKGFYFIALSDGINFHHCMGVSVTHKIYRAFDADYGEFEHASFHEDLSKMMLQSLIMQHYSYERSPYLDVTRLALK